MSDTKYDLSKCLGFEYPTEEIIWTQRDAIIYALSVGAYKHDFRLIYEKSLPAGATTGESDFAVFPTFATTLPFKGTNTDVFDFYTKFASEPRPDGLPEFDTNSLVQASQFIEILKPLPKVGEAGWKATKRVIGVHESSAGVDTDNEIILEGPDGQKYARLIAQGRYLKAVANGVPFSKTLPGTSGIPKGVPISSLGRPTWTIKGRTWPEQTALFRLNGDYNPLHIDPTKGAQLGYGGLICHGLGMFGITARAILEKLSESDPAALKTLYAGFIGPITPGDTLEISIWSLGSGPDDTLSIAFEARNGKGHLCLGDGKAYVIKKTVLPETNPNATAYVRPPKPDHHVANAPIPPQNPWSWVDQTFTYKGIPIRVVLTVAFLAPAIIGNLIYVTVGYLLTWWWLW